MQTLIQRFLKKVLNPLLKNFELKIVGLNSDRIRLPNGMFLMNKEDVDELEALRENTIKSLRKPMGSGKEFYTPEEIEEMRNESLSIPISSDEKKPEVPE